MDNKLYTLKNLYNPKDIVYCYEQHLSKKKEINGKFFSLVFRKNKPEHKYLVNLDAYEIVVSN